jgi:hypothetical protein
VGLRLRSTELKNCCVLNLLEIMPSTRVPAYVPARFNSEFMGRAWPPIRWRGVARCPAPIPS